VERVNEIISLNKKGHKPASLEINEMEIALVAAPLNSDLAQLDKKFTKQDKAKKFKKKKKKPTAPAAPTSKE
jgi:hypothetical protein